MLVVTRLFVFLIACITFIIASNETSTVLGLVSYAWSGLGAAIGPVIICSLFYKKTTKLAAIVGVISGAVSSVVFAEWKVFPYELFPAFTISIGLILLISHFSNHRVSAEVENVFKKFK